MDAGIIVLFVLLAIAGAAVSYWLKRQRVRALTAAAGGLGLEFSESDPFGMVDLPFALFRRGEGRAIENVMWGHAGGEDVRLFDYWYYTTSTNAQGHRSRTYHRFTCGTIRIDADCPHCTIESESFLSRVADHVGFRDVEFESEEFNRRFQVEAEDRKFAYALIDARMMGWLLAAEDAPRFEVAGPLVLCAFRKRPPEAWARVLEVARDFRGRVPAVVASLYPGRATP